jgi:hypothetical protein
MDLSGKSQNVCALDPEQMIHSACHVPASLGVEANKCWEMAVVCIEYSTMQLLPLPAAKGPCPHPKSSYVHLQIINNHSITFTKNFC